MKQVHAIQILGNPKRIDMQVACPGCSARAMAFSDGSIMCIAEGGACYEPEASDSNHPAYGQLLQIRLEYDRANGITVSQRTVLPTRVLGARPEVAPHGASKAGEPEGGEEAEGSIGDGDRVLFLNSAPSPTDNERVGGDADGYKPSGQLF